MGRQTLCMGQACRSVSMDDISENEDRGEARDLGLGLGSGGSLLRPVRGEIK